MDYIVYRANNKYKTKEENKMSEREKEMLQTFAEAFKKMDDFEKGRFLGRAEGMADAKEKNQKAAS